MPGRVYTFKADFAESTSSHNTGHSNYEPIFYEGLQTPAQVSDPRARTTIYGHPCVIFWKADSNATPVFMAKYNYNWDKGAENVFFGAEEEFPDVQSVEFRNNISDACLFHGPIPDSWGDDFEFRYPDEHDDISSFKIMHDWVVSTYQEAATGDALEEEYVGVDGTKYLTDTAEYRLAKFKKEFTDYFDFDFSLIYYLYTLVMLQVDQRAKNMFLTSWDQVHWQPWFYDQDTCFGINNEGQLVFDYYHEDHDTVDSAYVYNGALSTLWVNFRESFPDEIQELYQEWRSSKKLSFDNIVEYFITRQTDKWSISIYNEDADFKYIDSLRTNNDATHLPQIRGTGEEHLYYFASNRLKYLDSKFYATDYADDYIAFRVYSPDGDQAVAPNPDITITPFSNMYVGARWGAGSALINARAERNVPVTLSPSSDINPNDLEVAVYGASEISSIGDMSPLYIGYLNASSATKLTEIIVGSGVEGYVNENFGKTNGLSVGANKLLKKVDVRNCPNYVSTLDLSGCPNIQEIYATGSSIPAVSLPDSGYLKKIYLPSTITNLTLRNQQYIEEFYLDGYDGLTTLWIEDTVNVPVEDIMINASSLNRIRLIDVNWVAESNEALQATIDKFKACIGLDESGNNVTADQKKYCVTGRVKISSVSDELYNDVYENFPNLVIDDGSGKPYIINFLDRNGNSLYVTRVAEGADAVDPIEAGLIERPADIVTDDYTYEFVGWSSLPTNVHQHYKITPIYKIKYTISYYNGDELVYQHGVYQGDPAIDPVASGAITTPTKAETSDISYKFSGWDDLPINVQSSVSVYAKYDTYWAARFWNDNKLYLTEWVIDGGNVIEPKDHFEDYTSPTRTSTEQYDYVFSSWDGDFDTIMTSAREFYATYTNILRRYNVYFYNDTELLYTVEAVPYGSSTTYSGSTPVKMGVNNPDEYVFKGWSPSPENITGETYCYALFKFTGYLFGKLGKTDDEDYGYGTVNNQNWDTINAYWDTIANDITSYKNGSLSEDDFKTKYPIGGRMIIPLNLTDGTIVADVEIIGYDHDDLADDSGKATLTFFCADLPQLLRRMNEDSTNEGGYEASKMRQSLNGELLSSLPMELSSIIKPVYKISDGGSTNKALVTTVDSCWLASYDEVGLASGSNNLTGQGELYSAIFSTNKDSRKKYVTDEAATGGWWLRTSYYSLNSNSMFWRVTNSGGSYSDIAFNYFYVAFGFCI